MNAESRIISIVVPVYNEVESLERLRAQLLATLENLPATFQPVEIIYVDDGSQDGSFVAIARLVKTSLKTSQILKTCEVCTIL